MLTRRQLKAVMEVSKSKLSEEDVREYRRAKRVERAAKLTRHQLAEELVLMWEELKASQATAEKAHEAALRAQIELAQAQNDILNLQLRLQGAQQEVVDLNNRIYDCIRVLHRRMASVEMASGTMVVEDLFEEP